MEMNTNKGFKLGFVVGGFWFEKSFDGREAYKVYYRRMHQIYGGNFYAYYP